MSRKARVLQYGVCEVTQEYKGAAHKGIDIVKQNYQVDYIVAHSDGVVVAARNNCNSFENGSYGNYVKIKHDNGYYTLYGHMAYNTVRVNVGDRVSKGQVLGYMGNTGESYGAHLHFEVRNTSDVQIDPTEYLDKDIVVKSDVKPTGSYSVGDVVNINGVYVSSDSDNKLTPAVTKGTITKVLSGARNPYLLDDGNIGWINDGCIVNADNATYKTISNCSWLNLRTSASYGNNVYKAVQAGTKVEYLGTESGWAKIKYEGKILYCGPSYLG